MDKKCGECKWSHKLPYAPGAVQCTSFKRARHEDSPPIDDECYTARANDGHA